jgi:hypothetical protein
MTVGGHAEMPAAKLAVGSAPRTRKTSFRSLRIVAPVYFDVPAFLQLRANIVAALAAEAAFADLEVSFVVVDDSAGRDEEVEHLREIESLSVVVPPFNLGHQRAIVYGARLALAEMQDTDAIATLDADGEDRPDDLPRLLAALEQTAGDAVVLARRTRRRESPAFKVLYTCYRLFFRLLTGKVIRTGNYGAFYAALGRRLLRHPYFDLCYSSTFVSLETPIVYVPCERGSRYAGESRMSYARLLMHGLSMLMPFLDRIALRALIAFSVTMVASLLLSLAVVFTRIFTSAAIPGWATFTLLLLVILSFVALGNFVILFTVFSQSRGASLGNLEDRLL